MTLVSERTALLLLESGSGLMPLDRGRRLAQLLHPEVDPMVLEARPVGCRNAHALRVYADSFGDVLECELRCPACGDRLEFELRISDLLATHREDPGEIAIEHDGRSFRARVPTDADLRAVLEGGAGSGGGGVMARCAISPPFAEWPSAAVAAAEGRMAQADPLAVILLSAICPGCGHAWRSPFDAVEAVYERVTQQGRDVLLDVHRLARAYGWREADILAMNPVRRRQYLALLEAEA
ncbi:MAG: hypothetical protein KDC98_26620 [Planctomycetes bacterium]|nr:hypothetical protein [Planctomycetota bacterium]